jgi:hypothetical protein
MFRAHLAVMMTTLSAPATETTTRTVLAARITMPSAPAARPDLVEAVPMYETTNLSSWLQANLAQGLFRPG